MQQGFPGVIGRLGDLGEVSKDHDEVITTCCNRLDNIVVTDLATASSVLDFLKARRLGRATCIILDKIAEHRHYMNRPFENLPRAVRLFDLVKFKTEEAKLAFYFALNDTLYCEDSDLGL
jgi:structural maintenance of chromosome 4